MDPDRDAFDELTALFTTEPPPQPTTDIAQLGLVGGQNDLISADEPVEEIRAMHVTVAICGHLPVMAGLWVTQYADRIGETHGPTGLLRLEGGRCSLELFRTPRESARVDQGSSLLNSIELIGQSVRRWIVCVDENDAAEAVRAGVQEVAVLTGADKPAVLSAYRIAKTAGARVHSRDDLEIGLVVVGASPERTKAVGEVLAVAAEEFIGRPLEVVDSIQRMDVVESARRMLFAERERGTPSEAIEMLRSLAPDLEPEVSQDEEFFEGTNGVSGEDASQSRPPFEEGRELEVEPQEELELREMTEEVDTKADPELDSEFDIEMDLESALEQEKENVSEPEMDLEVSLKFVESDTDTDTDTDPPEATEPRETAELSEQRYSPPGFPRSLRQGVRLAPVVPSSSFGKTQTPPGERESTRVAAHTTGSPATEMPSSDNDIDINIEIEAGVDAGSMVSSDISDSTSGATVSQLRRRGEEGLCAHFPEYQRLEFQCPLAKTVELAVDGKGRLRLLCRDNELADARMALSWARANEKLIRAAVGALGAKSLEVMIDLVTDTAERVADLHRTGVRLYLLTPLDIQGEDRWFRVDLNTEETARVPE